MNLEKQIRILITGADGFIGKNLNVRLEEKLNITVIKFVRNDDALKLENAIINSDFIIHLAGENRPENENDYKEGNIVLTKTLCNIVMNLGLKIPIIFSSSTQINQDNPYGKSKLEAERILENLAKDNGNPLFIYRLPGVFGKWCRPDYNSVVATFCHNIANNKEILVHNPLQELNLVYIDDVIDDFLSIINNYEGKPINREVPISYNISLGDLETLLYSFKESRKNLMIEDVGVGIKRALYSTYLSYLPKNNFVYDLKTHSDERGRFVEVLKTNQSGQFSFFTAKPGVTRGIHYHHSKTEKFLVLQGKALFRFRNIITNEIQEIKTVGSVPQIVESIPGWVHSITNSGRDEMLVMLWANENFDHHNPDTITSEI